jgi:hypothetical protein
MLAGCARQESAARAPIDSPAAATAGQSAAQSTFIPSAAALERFRREGPDPTLRRIAVADYWLHYKLNQATGMEEALGGEAQAVRALKALGDAYERRIRGLEADVPRMIRTDFTGEGMASGFMGMGMGSFVGMLTGGLVSSLSDQQIASMMEKGPIRWANEQGSFEMNVGDDGSVDQRTEFEVNESGINGKVRIKTHMETCPDDNGRVTIDIEADSQMSVQGKPGTGGSIHTQMKYERYLDDDAHLIDGADGGAMNLRARMGGIENFQQQSYDVTLGYERGGAPFSEVHDAQGFSIFRPEEGQRVQELLKGTMMLQLLMAESALRGMQSGPPWEKGRCIDLKVTSSPAKRTGLQPSTSFDLEAAPRVKSDGRPAGGTVTATLTGGAQLQPDTGKVRADARYGYTAPEKQNETASIAFESRSKRGVGRATLDFDTKAASAYRIEGGADEFHGTGMACDLGQQFFVEGSGNTVRFEPSSPQGGRYSYSGTMSGFRVFGHGTYTVNYRDDTAVSIRASGPGSVVTPAGTMTREGREEYNLTPVDSAECATP